MTVRAKSGINVVLSVSGGLVFRTFLLMALIQASAAVWQKPRPLFFLEQPAVPSEYAPESPSHVHCPSLWVWPEAERMWSLLGGWVASFDQGPLGHARRKPTMAFVTSWSLYEAIHEVRGAPTGQQEVQPASGGFQSASWAKWAPGLVQAIEKAWVAHVSQSLEASQGFASSRQYMLSKMTDGKWDEHLKSDHIPYRPDCAVCIEAASRDRPHSLQANRHLFQLSADVAGPFKAGVDFGGSHRFFMAYSIRVPVLKDAAWTTPPPEEEEDAKAPPQDRGQDEDSAVADWFVPVQLKPVNSCSAAGQALPPGSCSAAGQALPQGSCSAAGQALPQGSCSAAGQALPQGSCSAAGQALPQGSCSAAGQALPQGSCSAAGQALPPGSCSAAGQALPQNSCSAAGQALPPGSCSAAGQALPQGSCSAAGQALPPGSCSAAGQALPQGSCSAIGQALLPSPAVVTGLPASSLHVPVSCSHQAQLPACIMASSAFSPEFVVDIGLSAPELPATTAGVRSAKAKAKPRAKPRPSRKAGTSDKGLDFMQEDDHDKGADVPPAAPGPSAPPQPQWVTIQWAEPLKSRKSFYVQLSVMRAVARLHAHGIPALRFHSDRAREFLSPKLTESLARQRIFETKSFLEDHASNGSAEVSVREVKRAARKCLSASKLEHKLWALAVRQVGEQLWRQSMLALGAPARPLHPFGTSVQVRLRQRQRSAWGPRATPGRLVGPAPQTLSSYLVLLPNKQLYISSAIYPAGRPSPTTAPSGLGPSCEPAPFQAPCVLVACHSCCPSACWRESPIRSVFIRMF